MKLLGICLLSATALLLGCAHVDMDQPHASQAAGTVCKDGKVLPPHSKCGLDKGVDRAATGAEADRR